MNASTIIQIGAVVAALGVVWRLVLRPLKKLIQSAMSTHDKIMEAVRYVAEIKTELGANGGASLRDTVDRIEAAVAFQDQRARALLQDASHGYIETDANGHLTFANRTHLRMTGRSLEELLGDGWINVISPPDRARLMEEWSHAVKDQRDLITHFSILSAHGVSVAVRSHCYVIKSNARVLGWAAILHTERREYRAEDHPGSGGG